MLRTSLALLTVLPVGRRPLPALGAGAAWAFPVVGIALGALWALVAVGGGRLWGPLVAAALVLLVDALATGGLHLDGVADVGDVAGSRRRGTDALAIARDPRVGALGVVALVTVLLVRFALVAAIAGAGTAWTLAAVPVVGRLAMLHGLARSPSGPGSSASALAAASSRGALIAATLLAGTAMIVVGIGGVRVLAALVGAALLVEAGTWWWRSRIAHPSGDLIGALGVGAELMTLAVLAA